ncbi:MAG: hypothetical protein GY811_11645 [Myxococcales bacterium]|nr:hypothetical protein [Myxococcales bacterium]
MNTNWLSVVALISLAGCSVGEVNNQSRADSGSGGNVDGATPSSPVFRPTIQEDLSAAGCLGASCHGGGQVPMQLAPSPASDAEWEANYQETRSRTSTLIPKATGAGGHSASMTEGDSTLVRWQAWISAGAPYEAVAQVPDAGTPIDAGPQADAAAGAVTWDSSIRQLLVSDGCTTCHGLQGAYSLETYSAALGFGTDQTVPNVIPGDANSLLITYYDNQHHTTSTANAELVRRWIVENDADE